MGMKLLTDDDVRMIRRSLKSCQELADELGTSRITVWRVKKRQQRAGVPDVPTEFLPSQQVEGDPNDALARDLALLSRVGVSVQGLATMFGLREVTVKAYIARGVSLLVEEPKNEGA